VQQPAPTANVAQAPKNAPPVPTVDRYGDALPRGAIARLGSIRFRQHNSLLRTYYLPNEILAVCNGNILKYYESDTGKLLREVPVAMGTIAACALTRDRKWLALAVQDFDEVLAKFTHRLVILDAATGAPRLTIELPDPFAGPELIEFVDLAISDDGSTAATSG